MSRNKSLRKIEDFNLDRIHVIAFFGKERYKDR